MCVNGTSGFVVIVVVVVIARSLEVPAQGEHHEPKEDGWKRGDLHPDSGAEFTSSRSECTGALEVPSFVACKDEEDKLDNESGHGEEGCPKSRKGPEESVGAKVQESGTSSKTGEACRDGLEDKGIRKLVDEEEADGVVDAVERLLVAKPGGRALGSISLPKALRPDTECDTKDVGGGLLVVGELNVEKVDSFDVW